MLALSHWLLHICKRRCAPDWPPVAALSFEDSVSASDVSVCCLQGLDIDYTSLAADIFQLHPHQQEKPRADAAPSLSEAAEHLGAELRQKADKHQLLQFLPDHRGTLTPIPRSYQSLLLHPPKHGAGCKVGLLAVCRCPYKCSCNCSWW